MFNQPDLFVLGEENDLWKLEPKQNHNKHKFSKAKCDTFFGKKQYFQALFLYKKENIDMGQISTLYAAESGSIRFEKGTYFWPRIEIELVTFALHCVLNSNAQISSFIASNSQRSVVLRFSLWI